MVAPGSKGSGSLLLLHYRADVPGGASDWLSLYLNLGLPVTTGLGGLVNELLPSQLLMGVLGGGGL